MFFLNAEAYSEDPEDEARHKIFRRIREYDNAIEAMYRPGVRDDEFRQDLGTLHATLTLLAGCNAVSVWWRVRSPDMLLCYIYNLG